ncbi:MAG: iron-sulfur cluster carrier protein ApbC [Bacteroidetes bacterium]|nr:iron-sulfur cluster carrier protein ApbC [Bacteroidota bacterium]
MKELTIENVLDTLKSVVDPDLKKDIVTLGFVRNLTISGNNVSFELQLTTPSCPIRDRFVEQCKEILHSTIDGIGTINITLTANVRAHTHNLKDPLLPGVKNTIAIASGKGGVGKSTVAVNVAVALAMDGARVGFLDTDVYGPSAPLMFGIQQRPQAANNKLMPIEKYGVKIMSIGFLINPMDAVIWRGPLASGAVKQFLTDVEWGELDYLIFDLPPGTGDVQLTLAQTIPLTGAVIVTTPQDVALADAKKGLVMFNRVNVPVLGIVENMSFYLCSACGHRDNIFDSGGGKKTAEELNVPFLGEIPLHTEIRHSGDVGIPIVYKQPTSLLAISIRQIAQQIAAQISIQHLGHPEKPKLEILL